MNSVADSPLLIINLRYALVIVAVMLGISCAASSERRVLLPEVESSISSVSEDVAAERYQKVYAEAADQWRQDATLEQSVETFKTLRTKLGLVENRVLQSVKEQENASGPLQGRVFIVTYRTKFEHGEGMETFTLVLRNGNWQLARYFVNSTALQ